MTRIQTAVCLFFLLVTTADASDREFRRSEPHNSHLLILVHGFTGHYKNTWENFPDLILEDANLAQYDVLMWGYPSKKMGKNPEIARIGRHFKSELDYLDDRYQHIVIAAHSMGGLVVRATVVAALNDGKRDDLTKIKQIVLFGTPNEGIDKADYVPAVINQQIADMKTASEFIVELRNQWLDRVYRAESVPDDYHLAIPTLTVAGIEDRFVPEHSVRTFFQDYATTDGDHVSMVKPADDNHLSFRILRKRMLLPATQYEKPLSEEARVYVENVRSEFINQLNTRDDLLAIKDQQIAQLINATEALAKSNEQGVLPPENKQALLALSQGNPAQAKSIFQSVVDAGELEARETAAAHRHLGALEFLDDTQKALDSYQRATELDPENADGWNQLAHLHFRVGNLGKSLSAYEKVLTLPGGQGKEWKAIITGNIGNVYRVQSKHDRALEMYQESLTLNQELGRKEGIANNYGNIGSVYMAIRKFDLALEMYEESMVLHRELGNKADEAINLSNMGVLFHHQNNLTLAMEMHERSLVLHQELGIKEGMATNYSNLGSIYKERQDYTKALNYFQQSLALEKELGRRDGMAIDYANVGSAYLNLKEFNSTRENWEKSEALYRELGNKSAADMVSGWLKLLPQ